ncbi:MAG: UDP-N-acetylglucosamine 1-carboxyvinyltransferase [Rickettsiales bacterium]|jgi:UDP-N-acetylglucosamine 1-carboxyvinyltransferase|nr:UDP-N-acetylglucosamine 1-carboxyvinyltransferase [Rickettsiales bacterium]
MKKLVVEGGRRLRGTMSIAGSKNASLPILMASILVGGKSTLYNVPFVSDIATTIELLDYLGASAEFAGSTPEGESIFEVDSEEIAKTEGPYEIVSKMRASFWVLGALLGRFGEARVSLPGGCSIGPRPCDIYMDVMEQMGAELSLVNGYVNAKAKAKNKKLRGADVTLRLPSVGATHNSIMAACLAEGVTTLRNVAREPEVVDLCKYLLEAGALISGFGTDTIVITGVDRLRPCRHRVIGDRVEAFSYMVAAAVSGGDVVFEGTSLGTMMERPLEVLREIGLVVEEFSPDRIGVRSLGQLKPLDIVTDVYPGFSTDFQAPLMALLGLVGGQSSIRETIFENRFMHVPELNRLGASIVTDGDLATIRGVKSYYGANVMASDIRAGMALVIAALQARGTTKISRVYHIERGYENFVGKLRSCGAELELMEEDVDG